MSNPARIPAGLAPEFARATQLADAVGPGGPDAAIMQAVEASCRAVADRYRASGMQIMAHDLDLATPQILAEVRRHLGGAHG